MKRTSRQPSKLSDSVHHQLNMYAIASSAAGIAALALAQPAEAKIVYTKTNYVIPWNYAYQLDLNHDGITDFLILNFGTSTKSGGRLKTKEAFGNAIQGSWVCGTRCGSSSEGFPLDSALKPGAQIGPEQGFIACFCDGESMVGGYWFDVKNRYLGLKFQIGEETHYGWARLNVLANQRLQLTATITGYAYETIPNKAILAGQTDSDDAIDPVSSQPQQPDAQNVVVKNARPESTSLGALALGVKSAPDWWNQWRNK
jgi:hypothetical protein